MFLLAGFPLIVDLIQPPSLWYVFELRIAVAVHSMTPPLP